MGQIAVLDQNMINMIAAGEVIERPASVVKELVENSIDAGATKITVAVEDGGRKLISVSDNGCGMGADDLDKAFEPHTTSKIRTAADLHGISTLGFRGEALASIASVARINAVSRTHDSPAANCLEIDCGNKTDVRPCSGDYGTTIQVRDLFYRLPARRKFLRTANTEMGHITEQFIRIALSACAASEGPEQDQHSTAAALDLTLIHNGRELYRLPAGQDLLQRIPTLFPTLCGNPRDDFIQVRSSERGMHIHALLGKPAISKTSTRFQYIFLNGRFIRDRFISHAIREAYRGLIEPNRFAVVFLFITMPFQDYDVNVHPTKTEVRFYNANFVHSQILGAFRERLLGTNLDVPAELPAVPASAPIPGAPASGHRSRQITEAMAEFFRKHRAEHSQRRLEFESKYHHAQAPAVQPAISPPPQAPPPAEPASAAKTFIQIHDSFIIAETDGGFVIIDQHALHERILYEDLHRRIHHGNLESQRLLIPQSFEVTQTQAALLEANAGLLERLGIELVPFGPRTLAVQAFPSLLAKADPADFILDLIDLLESRHTAPDPQALLEQALSMAACKAAIKAGQRLSDSEIEQLLARRLEADSASRCPHGRPTTISFSLKDLEKQFKRK